MTPDAPRDDQRTRVLQVAGALFADHGFDDVTMAHIAREAGVARATVFNYFGSKYAVVEAITETVLVIYRDMLDEALADDTNPTPELLRRLCEDMGKGIEDQRALFRGVFREIMRIQLGLDEGSVAERADEQAQTRVFALMQRGQRRGDLSDEFTAEILTTAFKSLVNGTIIHWLYRDDAGSLTARMRDVAEVFLSPIERQPARPAQPDGGT
jgi:AcrR family transcriptional regulator